MDIQFTEKLNNGKLKKKSDPPCAENRVQNKFPNQKGAGGEKKSKKFRVNLSWLSTVIH